MLILLVNGILLVVLKIKIMNQNNNLATDSNDQHTSPSNVIKDPEDWTTGNEQMTGAQQSYLHTLAREAGEEIDDNMTKADASKKIEELQEKTGRGKDH